MPLLIKNLYTSSFVEVGSQLQIWTPFLLRECM